MIQGLKLYYAFKGTVPIREMSVVCPGRGSSGLPDTKEFSKDDLKTPTKRHGSDDSGYLSLIRNSDTHPDW